MPIAAVPNFLGQDFKHASPGMRFGMYLPIWTTRQDQEEEVKKRAQAKSKKGQALADMLKKQGMDACIEQLVKEKRLKGVWNKNDFAARTAWHDVSQLSTEDKRRTEELAGRQRALAASTVTVFHLDAVTVAPFTTGLGNEHPLENGFAFLNPYGLPYLPGSGVKGVLRKAAQELASGLWNETKGWSDDKVYSLTVRNELIRLSMIDVLFGLESPEGSQQHVRGALSFWDVIPQIAGDSLMVEIMTPHQSHYYQQKAQAGSTTPHDSGQPNPICFLTVPPGSHFTFYVICDERHLERLTHEKLPNAPDLLEDGATHWKTLLQATFEHAFEWLGFGAKTAIGYGAMKSLGSCGGPGTPAASGTGGEKAPPNPGHPAEERWEKATLRWNPGNGELEAFVSGKRAFARLQENPELLPDGESWVGKLKKDKQLGDMRVHVRKEGSSYRIVQIDGRSPKA